VNTVIREGTILEDNFKMDLNEIRWEGVDRIHLAQDRGQCRALMNAEMIVRVAYNVETK
jgi:hypothetical protein